MSGGLRRGWLLRWVFVLLSGWVASSGCAFHATGLVEAQRVGMRFTEVTGERWRLVLLGPAEPIAALDGLLVEIDGQRVLRNVQVSDWRVREGSHGLPCWVGPIQRMGAQVGIEDRNSDQFFWLDEEAARDLAPLVGRVVLVEGWVDGPHRVRVMHYHVLDAE